MATKKKRPTLGLVVQKKGRLVDIPVAAKTVVRLREGSSGKVGTSKGIVVGVVPGDAFSRAYGKQVYVCYTPPRSRRSYIMERGAGDVYPVGIAKKVPAMCKAELKAYKARR